jgi:hypothetical protein
MKVGVAVTNTSVVRGLVPRIHEGPGGVVSAGRHGWPDKPDRSGHDEPLTQEELD